MFTLDKAITILFLWLQGDDGLKFQPEEFQEPRHSYILALANIIASLSKQLSVSSRARLIFRVRFVDSPLRYHVRFSRLYLIAVEEDKVS